MRKLFTIFVLALLSVSFVNAGNNALSLKTGLSAHDYPLDNGFILRGGIGITSGNYFVPQEFEYQGETVDVEDAEKPDYYPTISFGIEIGSQWYVWRQADETMGLAINVNWFDFQFGAGSGTETYGSGLNSYSSTATTVLFNISFIEFGPMYTYAVNDDIGLDAYFNLRPTLLMGATSYDGDDDSSAVAGFGLTYAAGASFRWRALLVGLEYGFGKVKVVDSDDTDYKYKVGTGMFKINIGVKL